MKKNIFKYLIIGYCSLYFMDGLISTIHIIGSLFFEQTESILYLRQIVALIVLTLSFPVIISFLLGSRPKLTPSFFLPFTFILTNIVGAYELKLQVKYLDLENLFFGKAYSFHSLYNEHTDLLIISLIPNLIHMALGVFALIWHQRHPSFFDKRFEVHWFKRASLAVVIPSLILAIFTIQSLGNAVTLIHGGSKQYIKFENGSLLMTEKVFKKGDTKVRLIPMMHIGKKEFYHELNKDLDLSNTLYLLEGVKDEKNLIKGIDHKKTAKFIGTDSQSDEFKPGENLGEEFKNIEVKTLVADIDASELSKPTVEILNFMSDENKDNMITKYMELSEMLQKKENQTLYYDIIEKRNSHLISLFEENESKYETIIIPWGALHMPDIEKRLEAMGYINTGKNVERVVLSLFN